jgi:uncharacterized protein YaaQ
LRLIIAVIQDKDSPRLVESLVKAGYSATKLASTGGFLREGNSTVLIGVEDEDTEKVTPVTPVGPGESYVPYPVGVTVGGATVFIVPVERFLKI